MPTFRRRKGQATDGRSPWFVLVPNRGSRSPPSYTFQLRPAGIKILDGMGLGDGDSFDMNEFWTLKDLGLIYTLGEGGEGAPSVQLDQRTVTEIDPEQRVAFVKTILNEYLLSEVQSDGFFHLLTQIDRGPEDLKRELIDFLLAPTPISWVHPDALLQDKDPLFTSAIFASLVCYGFQEFLDREPSDPISGYVEPIGANDEWVYLLTEEVSWDLSVGLSEFGLAFPEFYVDRYFSHSGPGTWYLQVVEKVHLSQFYVDIYNSTDRFGLVITHGLDDESVLIVPRESVADDDLDRLLFVESTA